MTRNNISLYLCPGPLVVRSTRVNDYDGKPPNFWPSGHNSHNREGRGAEKITLRVIIPQWCNLQSIFSRHLFECRKPNTILDVRLYFLGVWNPSMIRQWARIRKLEICQRIIFYSRPLVVRSGDYEQSWGTIDSYVILCSTIIWGTCSSCKLHNSVPVDFIIM
jgi:hypothetical protein